MRISLPKVDKTGRFCSPRASRELALLTLYAACLEGSDPLRLFERRANSRMEYNHMDFGGPPVTSYTLEEAHELQLHDQKESDLEAEVLSAPPKLVYIKLILRKNSKQGDKKVTNAKLDKPPAIEPQELTPSLDNAQMLNGEKLGITYN